MNFFADQLTQELAALNSSRGELAKRFSIPASNLSQFCSGKEVCGAKQLSKILAHVDEEAGARLGAAWLKDQIPKEIPSGKIQISLNASKVKEGDAPEWPDTDNELRVAMMELIKRSNRHPEIRSALLGFAAALTGK